ncbi:MAG: transporter substrate-binding domain-containing protein [Acidobacteriota bacterium]
MNRKTLLLPALITVFLLSACGETSPTFDNIRKNRLIAIGSSPFEAPLLYQTGQEWVGADAQLGQLINDSIQESLQEETTINIDAAWIGLPYGDLAKKVDSGEVSYVLGVYGVTEDRKELVSFSQPYYTSELMMMINPVTMDIRLEDLPTSTIGVREGTAVEQFVRAEFPESRVTPLTTLDDAILALRRGEVEAVIDDRYMAAYSLDTMPGTSGLEVLPTVLGTIEIAVAVGRHSPRLLEMINGIIGRVNSENLYTQWLEGEPTEQVARVEQRHPDRLLNEERAVEPRRIVIRVSKDDAYDFDIYRLANLSFTLTEEESGKAFNSSRIDFQKRVGVSRITLPPGTYKIVLPKFNNWSPGVLQVQPSDPDRVTVNIRLRNGGQVRMTRS